MCVCVCGSRDTGGRFECVGSDKSRNVIAVKRDDIRVLFWLKHSCTLNNFFFFFLKEHALQV